MNKPFDTEKFTVIDWQKKPIFSSQVDSHQQQVGPANHEISAVNATCIECGAQATFSVVGRYVVVRCKLHGSETVAAGRFA